MKLRGSLVLAHANTTTRSVGSFEALRLEVVRLAPPLRKVLTTKSTKNPKPTFSRFFITFLGVSR